MSINEACFEFLTKITTSIEINDSTAIEKDADGTFIGSRTVRTVKYNREFAQIMSHYQISP